MKNDIIQLWDTKIKIHNNQLDGYKSSVQYVGFSLDGLLVFSCGQDDIIRIWDSKEGKLLNSIYFNCDWKVISSHKGEFLLFWKYQLGIWYFKENKLITINLENQQKSYTIKSMKIIGNLLGKCYEDGNEIKIFDLKLEKLIRIIEVNTIKINNIFISPDGNWLSSLGEHDYKAQFLDLQKYEFGFVLEKVSDIMFSPDSQIVCLTNNYKHRGIRLFNLQGILFAQLDCVNSIQFSPNSKILASTAKQEIILVNSGNGEHLAILKGHLQDVKQYEFSPDGLIIASFADEVNIFLWDILQFKLLRILEGHESNIQGLTFSFNGKILVSYCQQSKIKLWDYREGKQIKTLEAHEKPIQIVLFSPNDEILVSCDSSYLFIVWDVKTWNKIVIYQSQQRLEMFTFSFNSKLLCFSKNETIICFLDYTVNENVIELRAHRKKINKIAFTPDNLTLISQSLDWHDKCILLWDTQNFQLKNILYGVHTNFQKVLLSNDDSKLVINQGDQYIRLYDPDSGRLLMKFADHKHIVQDIAFSPDCKHLASCSFDFTIKIWDVEKLQLNAVISFDNLIKFVQEIQFSPNSNYLITRDDDNGIRFLDINKKQLTNDFFRTSYINFSPDAIHLAYVESYKIHVWNYVQQNPYFEYKFEDCIEGGIIEFGCHGKWLFFYQTDTIVIIDIVQKQVFRTIQAQKKFQFTVMILQLNQHFYMTFYLLQKGKIIQQSYQVIRQWLFIHDSN